MIPDPALIWVIVAVGLVAVGMVVFMFKQGYMEDETLLREDKKIEKGEG